MKVKLEVTQSEKAPTLYLPKTTFLRELVAIIKC